MANKLDVYMKNNLRKTENQKTREQYQRACDAFYKYAIEAEGTARIKQKRYIMVAQGYADHLKSKGLSPDTVHTYMAGVVQGLGLSLDDLTLDRRTRPQKGRTGSRRPHTGRVSVSRYIGIRKEEYARLKGRNLVEKNGGLYVVVEKGKGGKRQEQYVLPKFFSGTGSHEYVFAKDELKTLTHANVHADRRELAREAYEYYKSLPKSEKEPLLEECHQRFLHKYDRKIKDPVKAAKEGERIWRQEMALIRRSPIRECRGENAATLRRQGRPIGFDREAVLLVSVLNLAHFREDVTVDNYLI